MSGALNKMPGIQKIDIKANQAKFSIDYDTTVDLKAVCSTLEKIEHPAKLLD